MFGVFSAWGLVAKFYSMPVHWTIARFEQILQTAWYEVSETEQQLIVPDVRGAGPWEVLPFRVANRESLTVAYVLLPCANFAKRKVHRWVKSLRSSLGLSELPARLGGGRQCPRC